MSMTEISPINIFTPAQEIKDTERFAGRDDELLALSTALQSHGAQIVLYGQRGVGKSSLARQLTKPATNDKDVVARLKQAPFEPLDFVPVYIACDDSIKNIESLMLRLLSDEEALAPWIPFKRAVGWAKAVRPCPRGFDDLRSMPPVICPFRAWARCALPTAR
jgi:hypothetical protein